MSKPRNNLIQQNYLIYFFTLFAILVGISRIIFATEINGLNYRVYQPDGFCYSVLAGKHSGLSIETISKSLESTYPEHIQSLNSKSCENLNGRFLYPFISAVFFKLFGLIGMLIIPLASFIFFICLAIVSFKKLRVHLLVQITILSLVISSLTISRWFISNLTEPLLYSLGSYLFFRLIFFSNTQWRNQYLYLVPLITTMSLTKRSLHIFVIIGTLLLLTLLWKNTSTLFRFEKTRNSALHISLLFYAYPIILDKLIFSIFNPQNSLAVSRVIDGWSIFEILQMAVVYIYTSIGQVFSMDWPLAILICLWLLSSIVALQNMDLLTSLGFLGPVFILVLSSLHLTVGLNLRFELCFLFPLVLMTANTLNKIFFDNI